VLTIDASKRKASPDGASLHRADRDDLVAVRTALAGTQTSGGEKSGSTIFRFQELGSENQHSPAVAANTL
jgi:hypothetical protein